MDISIIISTWNRSKRLEITLDAICKCTIPEGIKWELVLVNNNCTDDTDNVVERFTKKIPILYIKEPQQGLSRARNAGLKAASGELIIFTDDDVKPCLKWIELYWVNYREKYSGYIFGGPIYPEYEMLNPDKELLRFAPASEKGLHWGNIPKILSQDEDLISANWACPSMELRKTKGFDINKGIVGSFEVKIQAGEETDLMNNLERNGSKRWYIPEASVMHYVPAKKCTLNYIAARREYNGYYNAKENNYIPPGILIYGIPRWMYKEAFILWSRWLKSKIFRKNGYEEYINFRRYIGTLKGIKEIVKNRSEIDINRK